MHDEPGDVASNTKMAATSWRTALQARDTVNISTFRWNDNAKSLQRKSRRMLSFPLIFAKLNRALGAFSIIGIFNRYHITHAGLNISKIHDISVM